MSGDSGWYVYAVIAGDDVPAVAAPSGIDGVPAQLLVSADLAAVAAPVDLAAFRGAQAEADMSADGWLARAVRGHHQVVEEVFAQASVLPLRFGALCATRADVLLVLESLRPRLRAGLTRVAGAGEWTVRLVGAEPRGDPAAADPSAPSGTAWMLRRRASVRAREVARERWAKAATAVYGTLARHARETCVAEAGVRYLVARADETSFRESARELRESELDSELWLDVDGPRPAFHFTEERTR
ncbi:GvpL/GvpF family gas vesicle protein [Phytohabitans rumicis]|uniref:Gas vesicle protein n=1 Tax=Phytohabitans rumicis TaxID=1076125 RepID=A0A6V8LHD3_9ACTN|nr:GvpL/GvpF family gas vesicle protein [Phytohabitans rumicis]GFJ94318.1 hypothetical protein Prum_079600 [Phytohabitans rumicis]